MPIAVESVTVRFGGHVAVSSVDLEADDGRVTALIGPNGAGKTTLFDVMAGIRRPDGGSVSLDGIDVTDRRPDHRARAGLGRTFQRLELFGALTVRENLLVAASALPRRRRDGAVDALIGRLSLGPVAARRCDTLPTGTGRLVELARALVLEPRVLLLDEPASGQDDAETEVFSHLLLELADEGLAVVLVEHDMNLVMGVADRIHVLDFGRMIASGTPDEIRADPLVRSAYLGEEIEA